LELALAHLTETETRTWEWLLNREWTACGCREGEIAAIIAIGAYILSAFLGFAPATDSAWGQIGWATLAALVGAAAGKIVGRIRSIRRFRRLVRQLQGTATTSGT
jgi:hypothetical protein